VKTDIDRLDAALAAAAKRALKAGVTRQEIASLLASWLFECCGSDFEVAERMFAQLTLQAHRRELGQPFTRLH